ncbi:MAG: hypothetical protein E6G01_16575 [Actinobacteria bacterium]|nr:MAG: hypothetical protein E6G01_16575 [Actinomycetota bacterium]
MDRAGRVALLPGDLWNLKVRVRNRSRVRWPPDTVRVGNHWLGPDGQLLCLDDGRAEIPWEMVPGKEAVVSLWTVTPTCPGRHVLELDAVCEGHSWFSQRGSPTCRVPVVVKEGAGRRLRRQAAAIRSLPNRLLGSAGTDVAPPEPPVAYEMHCVPRDDVLAAVGGEGCEITEVMEDGACGPGSVSYVYTVTKPVRAEDS